MLRESSAHALPHSVGGPDYTALAGNHALVDDRVEIAAGRRHGSAMQSAGHAYCFFKNHCKDEGLFALTRETTFRRRSYGVSHESERDLD